MKKIFKLSILSLLLIILSSCNRNDPDELSDLILTPEQSSPVLEGTWQVTKVEQKTDRPASNPPKVGDRLYISKNLVAINKEYAFPPNFTAKYVNLGEYIKNRGFEFNNIDPDESVVVVNASQGQFFARDFIKRSDDEIFYVADDNLVYLSKLSNSVDSEIVNEYTKLATTERVAEDDSENIIDDVSILLGVRERIDRTDEKPDYNYYTYLIRVPDDQTVKYKKAPDIFLRGQDEYWKVRSRKNRLRGIYDSIEAFPVRLENEMDQQDNLDRYSFKDFDMNIRLTYASTSYISFSYTRELYDNTITKYGVVGTNELDDNSLITVDEFTGENDASDQLKNMIKNEVLNKVNDINPDDVIFDPTNFGLIRESGNWVSQTSIYTKDSQQRSAAQVPIRTIMDDTNQPQTRISRDQVRNINSQFKDYFIVNNSNLLVIQTADEILIHKINEGLIDKKPFHSIPTPNPTAFISIDQQNGQNAEVLSKAFSNFNTIIESN